MTAGDLTAWNSRAGRTHDPTHPPARGRTNDAGRVVERGRGRAGDLEGHDLPSRDPLVTGPASVGDPGVVVTHRAQRAPRSIDATTRPPQPALRAEVRALLGTRAGMRQALLAAEVLGPPVAQRGRRMAGRTGRTGR